MAEQSPITHVVNEILEVIKDTHQERVSENIPEQSVDVRVPKVELAESSGEAWSPWSRADGTTSAAATAEGSVGEARLLWYCKVQCHAECRRAT